MGTADPRPTIVFLHGTRLTGASWAAQAEDLADEFHVLTPDLPGHGSAADAPFTIDVAAARVADLIATQAHDGRAVVVGLSLGGYVAMAVAAGWPDRVRGLAISGATAEPAGPRAFFYRALATAYRATPTRLEEALNTRYYTWRYPVRITAPILADGYWFGGGAGALRSLVGERFKPRLAAYPGPSLLINGEYDVFFRSTERSFANVAANPRRVVIRGARHMTNLDRPEAFTRAVRQFARAVTAPSAAAPPRDA